MACLVDTNVLLRRLQPGHASYHAALVSVARLLEDGESIYFTFQNVSEFWNVATRPIERNGMGLQIQSVLAEVRKIESVFLLLPESAFTYSEWIRLIVQHNVSGSKVHDAKLVAAMNIHGIGKILTFNTSDFRRYNVEAVDPKDLLW